MGFEGRIVPECCSSFCDTEEANRNTVYPLLKKVVGTPFFSHFEIDLCSSCELWEDQPQCRMRDCSVCECEEPPVWSLEKNAGGSSDSTDSYHHGGVVVAAVDSAVLGGWETLAPAGPFGYGVHATSGGHGSGAEPTARVVDLLENPEGYTGYTGPSAEKVWSAVHSKNCFQTPNQNSSSSSSSSNNIPGRAHAQIYREKLHSVEEKLRSTVQRKREQLAKALESLSSSDARQQQQQQPGRLKRLRERHEIVGERLIDVKKGKETVQEILHAAETGRDAADERMRDSDRDNSDKPPLEPREIIGYLDEWFRGLHQTLGQVSTATYPVIWQAYHDYVVKTLYAWDREYLSRMPPRRDDGSIFLSLASYRDASCADTIRGAYRKAKHPENLFVGLVQQNCHRNCVGGVREGGSAEAVAPDADCYESFCGGEGKEFCDNGQVRLLDVAESESLGPYAARYFASKLWFGEEWYMQIDAHTTFARDWDETSVEMLRRAPSEKPVITHYPPVHTENLDGDKTAGKQPAPRICVPLFSVDALESQVVRLDGSEVYDTEHNEVPRFAPFAAAGYFVAHSDFLREVPFDPFLPWIFMGEEIIMSTRLWTSGYDIFSPSQSVVGHMYVRQHQPKFWETVGREFSPTTHDPLQMMILDRIKYQLGYPEAAKDMIGSKSLLTAVEQYSMGTERILSDYMELIGLDTDTKEISPTNWCQEGIPPPGFEQFYHLYK